MYTLVPLSLNALLSFSPSSTFYFCFQCTFQPFCRLTFFLLSHHSFLLLQYTFYQPFTIFFVQSLLIFFLVSPQLPFTITTFFLLVCVLLLLSRTPCLLPCIRTSATHSALLSGNEKPQNSWLISLFHSPVGYALRPREEAAEMLPIKKRYLGHLGEVKGVVGKGCLRYFECY